MRSVLHEVFARKALRRTTRIALVVGMLVTLINQASVISEGGATASTWVRVGLNFLLPFCVSSVTYVSTVRAAATRFPEAR